MRTGFRNKTRCNGARGGSCPLLWAALCLLVFPASAPGQQIYKYLGPEGEMLYTDEPQAAEAGSQLLKVWTWKAWEGHAYNAQSSRNRELYAPLIEIAAHRHALSPQLVHAVVQVESSYRPDAVSRAGAVGLMQLMPGTALRFGVADRLDPGANLEGGSRYLRHLLLLFDGDLELALAAYNAGEGAVLRAGRKIPPYRETRRYVSKVLSLLRGAGPGAWREPESEGAGTGGLFSRIPPPNSPAEFPAEFPD